MASLIARAKIYLRHSTAQGLGLEPDAPASTWLARLLFQPPRTGRRDLPALWMASLGGHLEHELGIAGESGFGVWLRRLFFRPRHRRARLAANLRLQHRERKRARRRALLGKVGSWFKPVYGVASHYGELLRQRLPGVDWDKLSDHAHRFSAGIDRLPYLKKLILLLALVIGLVFCTTPLQLGEQFRLFLCVWLVMVLARRVPGRGPTMLMVSLAVLMAGRYIWWRTTQTLNFNSVPEAIVGYILYSAEIYTWIVLFFGYAQTIWPLNRKPRPLPPDPASWPTVDVYIPTYNEALSVVVPTVLAANSMDWPREKLRVYLLDDGSREDFRAFAESVGVGYLTREEHNHAKAGNINHALPLTQGEYIAIFDCDHIPTRSFLQTTMGEFLADPKCALVQTPHHFFSPDPFERNYDTFHRVPNEGSLFYGLIQDGNDFWNAAFFCGSCAVLKRAPLEEVGGIAVETVTEDAHTSLKLHRRGYRTAYLRVVQAAGLATDSLADHVGQRIRWARGMTQIFRIDNPLLGKGLTFFQRICYSNAMLHFFYGIPRLIFLAMPCAYLYFGLHVFNAQAISVFAYVVPYLFIAGLANSRIQGQYRHSFWAEIYESVLAWYIVLPTTLAFINPRLGKFNVTSKGGVIKEQYLDWTISKPYLFLLALNLVAILVGFGKLLFGYTGEPATIWMNMVWAMFNLTMLGAAVGVATEARQIRVAHHIPLRVPATLVFPDGRTLACHAENYSTGGLGILLPLEMRLTKGEAVDVALSRGPVDYQFPAVVVRCRGVHLGVRFEQMTQEKESQLIECTFGRADAWVRWQEQLVPDAPLHSFFEVVDMGYQGFLRLYDACMDAIDSLFSRRTRESG
ncbi:UDP-forming cellulose synthase catalytic subunit [Dyella sp. C9]|uniref:UDP-forming cellulose synthase catalytic subunit n=1 Tax=Dyella sp. C9 TaxID=2202154 RepID=UPI000DEF4927|nr:UDP-forming cellulose synthase catalytic subunit [Dyella sp. C9]